MTIEQKLSVKRVGAVLQVFDPAKELSDISYQTTEGDTPLLRALEFLKRQNAQLKQEAERKEYTSLIPLCLDVLTDSMIKGILPEREAEERAMHSSMSPVLQKNYEKIKEIYSRRNLAMKEGEAYGPQESVADLLVLLADQLGANYVSFTPNPAITSQQPIEVYKNGKGIKRVDTITKQEWFKELRAENPKIMGIDFEKPKDYLFSRATTAPKDLEGKTTAIRGSFLTMYLKPGNDVVGAIQIAGAMEANEEVKQYLMYAKTLMDTFLLRKLEAMGFEIELTDEQTGDDFSSAMGYSASNAPAAGDGTDETMAGAEMLAMPEHHNMKMTTGKQEPTSGNGSQAANQQPGNEKAHNFYRRGSYFFEKENYTNISKAFGEFFYKMHINSKDDVMAARAGWADSQVETEKERYDLGFMFIRDFYQGREEYPVSEEDVAKDQNSAISIAKLILGLMDNYGDFIKTNYKSSLKLNPVKEDLTNAAIFTGVFARALKYMPAGDRFADVRARCDMAEMTSYLAYIVEGIENKYTFEGKPIMGSAMGGVITELCHEFNPKVKGQFLTDLIEMAIKYEELVQDSTSSPAMPVKDALRKCYLECNEKNTNEQLAVFMIDTLVNPSNDILRPGLAKTYAKYITPYAPKIKTVKA